MIAHREQMTQRWGWLLVKGVLDVLLAAFIVLALPGSAIWALGLIIPIDLVFGDSSLIAIALVARQK